MICKNCGANMGAEVTECPYCGTVHSAAELAQEVIGQPITHSKTANPLAGKEYAFSGNDLLIKGRWGITTQITVDEDRLFIETTPAKKNVIPVIMLEDILAIENRFHMRRINIALAVLGLLGALDGSIQCLILPILAFVFYRERKMKIHLRSGQILTIYSSNAADAEAFIEDMKQITKIK